VGEALETAREEGFVAIWIIWGYMICDIKLSSDNYGLIHRNLQNII